MITFPLKEELKKKRFQGNLIALILLIVVSVGVYQYGSRYEVEEINNKGMKEKI